jgi:hypothetical protein
MLSLNMSSEFHEINRIVILTDKRITVTLMPTATVTVNVSLRYLDDDCVPLSMSYQRPRESVAIDDRTAIVCRAIADLAGEEDRKTDEKDRLNPGKKGKSCRTILG